MFCKECGAGNEEGASFCKECGKQLNGSGAVTEVNKEYDKTVKYNIKPTYNWGYKIITVGLASILVMLFIIFYLFGEYTGYIFENFSIIVVAVFVVYVGGRLLFEKLQYNKLNYNFYSDRVEYVDGFLNISEKELKYKNIRETAMTQNIIERIFKIGTIRIHTNARSGIATGWGARNQYKNNLNGITIHCVREPKEQYSKIKELIDLVDSRSDD